MENPNITMEEYIELEAEKAHKHGQTFKWETVTYGKVRYYEDIDYFKDFEIDFAAIVYKDALVSDHEISSEPTFSYKSIFVNDLKTDLENDNDEVNISSDDVAIEQSDSGIDANVDTQPHEFNKGFKMNHDIHRRSFNMKDYLIIIKVMIQKHFHVGMPLIFMIKNLYVPFGIPFDPKRFYKDGAYTKNCEGQ
ncbi:hypothetical protein Tco_1241894, partial [Tanacetum coccineum]